VEYVGSGECGDERNICGGRESDGGGVECVYGELEWRVFGAYGGREVVMEKREGEVLVGDV
jgi:hypothetical protein